MSIWPICGSSTATGDSRGHRRIGIFQNKWDAEFIRLIAGVFDDEPDQGQVAFHVDRWETCKTLADRPHLWSSQR